VRTVLVVLGALALLFVFGVGRAAYDDGQTPEERRCSQLRAAANAVPSREDTVDDELEYLRLTEAADKTCSRLP
jgi:hypothetical protein